MNELTRPFVRIWEYAGQVGGFPGQMFFVIVIVMLLILLMTWIGNRR
ncbi:MAG: hypothetical protein U0736_28425 [Gemmataceae bacterium]